MYAFFLSHYADPFFILLSAVLLDLVLGDPYALPHPVKLMGFAVKVEEKLARKAAKTGRGLKVCGLCIACFNTVFVFCLFFFLSECIKRYPAVYFCLSVWFCYTCIAARCLQKEACKVFYALEKGIGEGRRQVANIVGRDTETLTEAGIIRSCVETVAENTGDGVIAPLLFIIFFGTAGGMAYKMINTMDSMLGYKNEKYGDLGFFAAKLDDAANYIPARLCALLMIAGSVFTFDRQNRLKNGFRVWRRDRKKHPSPNSAHPESAAAGLLGIKLGGPNFYGSILSDKPYIGDELKPIEKSDIKRCIKLMYAAEVLLLILYGLCTLAAILLI